MNYFMLRKPTTSFNFDDSQQNISISTKQKFRTKYGNFLEIYK